MQTLENLEQKFLSVIPIKPFELGNSGILIQLAGVYTELFEIKHFEPHGFTPDIKCPDGTDAFAVAMPRLTQRKNNDQDINSQRNGRIITA